MEGLGCVWRQGVVEGNIREGEREGRREDGMMARERKKREMGMGRWTGNVKEERRRRKCEKGKVRRRGKKRYEKE